MKVPYFDMAKNLESIRMPLMSAFEEFLKSGRIVLGPQLLNFESEYAKFTGTRYSIGVGSGLDAITFALESVGVTKGDEVIVPSNAYIAALNSLSRLGAFPVFVEPKESTFNIDPGLIEKAITKKTKAIIPVHFFGQICEMGPIMSLAKKYKINVVEDNAQSHGSTYKGKISGSFGLANATSFYPTKNIGALGEGGAVSTNSVLINERIRMLRNYGEKGRYDNKLIGYNSRMDELQAAFLRIRLRELKKGNKRRREIASIYMKGLDKIHGLILPVTEKNVEHVFHIFAIKTDNRDQLQKYLSDNNITTIVHYPRPPYLQDAYTNLGYKKGAFPIAEKLCNTSLSLPINTELTNNQIEYVVSSIKKYFSKR